MVNGWEVVWEKGSGIDYVVRYYKYHARGKDNLQLGKYRGADDLDKHLGVKQGWHNKWYVNVWNPEKRFLFNTKKEAKQFISDYMRAY